MHNSPILLVLSSLSSILSYDYPQVPGVTGRSTARPAASQCAVPFVAYEMCREHLGAPALVQRSPRTHNVSAFQDVCRAC